MLSLPTASIETAALAILVSIAVIVIARRSRRWRTYPIFVSEILASRWSPVVAGVLTALIVRFVWGSFGEPGVVHDERAYLLQAEIFARGRWTASSPPLPAFFEQMHVFIEPAVFAKYPPAHALMLVPGIWLGLPGLMPVLLTGLSGGLVYWIARRLANEWVALLTWWLWTTTWATLMWSTSYFSETTSTAMWLLAAWGTIRWRDSGQDGYLACVAGALAWGFNARPLTLAALGLPLAYVIVRRLIARREWRPLVLPVLVGVGILALGPIWNQQTLGDWRQNPYPYYSEVYFPFDRLGFGLDTRPPLRPLPPEMARVGDAFRYQHESYVPLALPSTVAARIIGILKWCSDSWRLVVGLLILGAVLHGTAAERFGLIASASLLLCYLAFAHAPMWVVYYVEVFPILHFLAACELGRILHKLAGIGREEDGRWPAPVANASVAVALVLLALGMSDAVRARSAVDRRNGFHRAAQAALDAMPPSKAIVFVAYPPNHDFHFAVTRNEPDLNGARQWLVYDRGPLNTQLQALAPDRVAYRFDLAQFRIVPLVPAVVARSSHP